MVRAISLDASDVCLYTDEAMFEQARIHLVRPFPGFLRMDPVAKSASGCYLEDQIEILIWVLMPGKIVGVDLSRCLVE